LKVPPEESSSGLGIRGDAEDGSKKVADSVNEVDGSLKQLAQAIYEAIGTIKSAAAAAAAAAASAQGGQTTPASTAAPASSSGSTEVAAAGGGPIRRLEPGGHVSGPGTSTSDSIPAMLSDGEYVIRAESARKLGRGALDRINAGHFARGGSVARLAGGGLSSDWFDPDLTDEESIQLLNQAVLSPQQLKLIALNNAKTPNESIKLLNRFIMGRSGGGPIGHFASGGTVSFGDSVGHLFSGGGAPDVPSLGDLGAGGLAAGAAGHVIDLRTNSGDFRAMTSDEVLGKLKQAARDSNNVGSKAPGWAYGS
jgi:hypothetical protein